MDDSGSNLSSCSTLEEMNEGNSEKPVNNIAMGLVQQSSNIDNVTTSTSLSDMNVDSMASNSTFQDISGSSNHGASSLAGNQSLDSSFEGDQSGDMNVFHTKRKIHGKDKKVCRVCGDKALGYNFNAMTCESCKAFFRRNALKQQTPNCMFQGNCVVDVRTRRFCPHCRLKKCFNMGMKKEMILEHGHKIKLEDTVVKRKIKAIAKQRLSSKISSAVKVTRNTVVCHPQSKQMLSQLEPLPGTSRNLADHDKKTDQSLFLGQSGQLTAKSNKSSELRTLTDEERELTSFLEKNFLSGIEAPAVVEVPGLPREMQDYYLTFAAGYAKIVIKFLKSVDDFKLLELDVQIRCLQESIQCCFVLIAAFTFDTNENCFVVKDKKLKVDNFKKCFESYKESTEFFLSIVQSMQDPLFKDPCLVAIFILILVFSPFWENHLQRRYLSNIQDKYLILLKHYLEAKYSYSKGKEFFVNILQKIKALRELKTQGQKLLHELKDKMTVLAKQIFHA